MLQLVSGCAVPAAARRGRSNGLEYLTTKVYKDAAVMTTNVTDAAWFESNAHGQLSKIVQDEWDEFFARGGTYAEAYEFARQQANRYGFNWDL